MYRPYIDQTLDYFDRPHVGAPAGPVPDPAAWRAADLDPSVWTHELSGREQAWFADQGRSLAGGPTPLADTSRDTVGAAGLEDLIARCRADLDDGRGLVLLRGVPVDDLSVAEVEAGFWALGLLLGEPGAQNGAGELLGHVRDHHDDPDLPLRREYRSAVDIDFHCDAADVVGLLCLAEAATGGDSRVVSSVQVFNDLVEQRPDLAARLCEDVQLDTRDDGEGFTHVPVRPVCFDGRRVRTFMHLGYFRSAARHPGVELDPPLAEALDLWSSLAADPRRHVDMRLRRGDIQLCSNHTIAHARSGYVDAPDAPRHLLRLWLTL